MTALLPLSVGISCILIFLTLSVILDLHDSLRTQELPPENTPISEMMIVAKVLASGLSLIAVSISATLVFGFTMAILMVMNTQATP